MNKSVVKNKYMWLLVVLPFLSYFIVWIGDYIFNNFILGIVAALVFLLPLEIWFIKKDFNMLKNSEKDISKIGEIKTLNINIPKYLLNRAKTLGKGTFFFGIWLIGYLLLIVILILEFNPLRLILKDNYIEEVKKGNLYLCSSYSMQELVDNYILNPKWESKKEQDKNIVSISGIITYNEMPVAANIKYYITDKEFSFKEFSIGGIIQTEEIYLELVGKMCNNLDDKKLQNSVISFADGSVILKDDLYDALKTGRGLETVIFLIDKKIYEQEMNDKKTEALEYVQNYMEQLTNMVGGDIENYIKNYGYSSLQEFKDNLYVDYLRNEATLKYIQETKDGDPSLLLDEKPIFQVNAWEYYYQKYGVKFIDEDLGREYDDYMQEVIQSLENEN